MDYSYYSGYGWWSDDLLGTFSASGYGSVGDLEFAGVADGSGVIFDTTYFRYDSGVEVKYIDDGASLEEYPIFEESGVTQMFSNPSFARLVAANGGSVAAAVSSSYADAALCRRQLELRRAQRNLGHRTRDRHGERLLRLQLPCGD